MRATWWLYDLWKQEPPRPAPQPEEPSTPSAALGAGMPRDIIRQGDEAHRLLHNPVLAQAFADIRSEAQAMWAATKPNETEKREELYRVTQALELVRGKLIGYRGAAQVARRVAQQEESDEAA